ncbi:MAG: peptidylprolyl isomerase [Myxococcales bacterium]|nr:peptidylprolyl isomerase [Myxococcales bacterium]
MRTTPRAPLRVALLALTLGACVSGGEPRAFDPPIPELVAANEANGDPYGGRFPYEEAIAGLEGEGSLRAVIETDVGTIHCRLEPETAPITVATFVGLARGLRPFQEEEGGPWVTAPFYDGLPWHRAVEGQFVQGGRRGSRENPGFQIQDEISPGAKFDRAGVMGLAHGPERHSGAAQFFLTSSELTSLNGEYTIFGRCEDHHVIRELERRVRGRGEPPRIVHVTIERR